MFRLILLLESRHAHFKRAGKMVLEMKINLLLESRHAHFTRAGKMVLEMKINELAYKRLLTTTG